MPRRSVVKLQEEVIVSKEERLQSLRSSVLSAVQETVKTEIRTLTESVVDHNDNSTQVVARLSKQ